MGSLRGMLALLVVVLLAACGNDPGTPVGNDAAGTAAPDGTEGTPQTAGGAAADAEADLGELCETAYASVEAPEGFSVGLVTDIGQVDDGTFNQFAFEGMQAAEACFGIETDVIETANQADYARNLSTVLSGDPDVVVTVGFLLGSDTRDFALAHPGTRFVGVDQPQDSYPDNYVGVLFREDQAGFLAGSMAGLLTESGVVGVVGGREDVPAVARLVNGFVQGAQAIDPSITPLRVFIPSFSDRAAGASAVQQFLGEGADVIFGAGGQTGSGAIRAAATEGAWVIGVDQDEYFTTFGGGEVPGADRLATSAIKRVDLGVFMQIAEAVTGTFSGGTSVGDVANGGVTYAPSHEAPIPAEVAQQLEQVRQGLADGSIETGVDPVTGELRSPR